MQVATRTVHEHFEVGDAPESGADRRDIDSQHSSVAYDHRITCQPIGRGSQERLQVDASDFFLTFEAQLHVHRHPETALDSGLERLDVHQDLALVVVRAACVDAAVLVRRLERRRVPELLRVYRLNVVVSIDQHGRRVGIHDLVCHHERISFRRDDLDVVHPRLADDIGQPLGAAAHVGGVSLLGAHAGNAKEIDELLFVPLAVGADICGQI